MKSVDKRNTKSTKVFWLISNNYMSELKAPKTFIHFPIQWSTNQSIRKILCQKTSIFGPKIKVRNPLPDFHIFVLEMEWKKLYFITGNFNVCQYWHNCYESHQTMIWIGIEEITFHDMRAITMCLYFHENRYHISLRAKQWHQNIRRVESWMPLKCKTSANERHSTGVVWLGIWANERLTANQ